MLAPTVQGMLSDEYRRSDAGRELLDDQERCLGGRSVQDNRKLIASQAQPYRFAEHMHAV